MLVKTENFDYHFDFDAKTVKRVPKAYSGVLRRDEESLHLFKVNKPVVGQELQMFIDIREDGIETYRRTSPITSVDGVEEWEKWHVTHLG